MVYSWHDVAGNIGVALIVITYGLVQIRQVSATSFGYSVLNAVGAALILYSLIFAFNLSAFLMEAFWLVMSLVGGGFALRERVRRS